MNECEKLRNDLKAFLDGQLSPAARIAMRLHLNRCESCRKEIEEMRLLGTNMRTADSLEMSDALRSRILASVPTTAPPATVKMLPKWREKPVLIWGASASAALAWFVLYPAMSDYQNHASRSAKTAAASRRINVDIGSYVQDYDGQSTGAANGLPSGVAQTGTTAGQHYYAGGKNDVVPSWMTRRLIPQNLQGKIGGGRAPGDSGVLRQTELVTKADPTQQVTDAPYEADAQAIKPYNASPNVRVRWSDNAFGQGNGGIRNGMPLAYTKADEKYLYYDSDRVTDSSGVTADGHTPYSLYANGLTPKVRNGDGSPVGGTDANHIVDQLEVVQGDRILPNAYKDGAVPKDVLAGGAGGQRSDRRYIPPTQSLLVEGKQTTWQLPSAPSEKIETDPAQSGHGVARYTFPRTVDLTNSTTTTDLYDLPAERQVHKDASLTVEVANAEQQSEAVERLVKESKGYVAQNQLTTVDDGTRQASLTCKVPVDQFDTMMGQLARLGLLKGKTLSGEDITDKVIDEQETGHVLRADIATTEEKLKERKRHSDAVRDEETLRQLRIRVAQSQARLKMLTKLGALSEITVELDEKPKNAAPEVTKPANPFMEEVSGTGQAAAHSFLMALRLPVQLLVWIVVYSPLWALLIYGYRRMTR